MCSQSVGPIQGVNLKNILNKKEVSYNFSLVHFNCRSMASNFDKVKDSLKGLDFPFDVIAVSETWQTMTLIHHTP